MPNSTIITEAELRKALEMINVYNQVYCFSSQALNIDPEALAYFQTLQREEWIVPIKHNNSYYGSVTKNGDSIRIVLSGMFTNLWSVLDCMRLNYDQSFYGIDTFVSSTFARFYYPLHYQIQNILLVNPQITKIQIIGYSYGTALAQVLAVVLHKVIKFHRLNISSEGYNTINSIYGSYLIPHLNQMLSMNPNDPMSKEVRSRLLQPSLSAQPMLDALHSIDRDLFNRVELESTHTFSPLHTFTDTVLQDPDLNLVQSASAFHLGNQMTNDFFNNTYGYSIKNDPISSVLDSRTLVGGFISRMNNDPGRSLIGKVVILNPDFWLPTHTHNHYINTLYRSMKNRDSLNVYSHLTFPVTEPYPAVSIPYLSIQAIKSGSLTNILIGLAALALYIAVVAVIFVAIYHLLYFALAAFGVG